MSRIMTYEATCLHCGRGVNAGDLMCCPQTSGPELGAPTPAESAATVSSAVQSGESSGSEFAPERARQGGA